jgi:hypothetical protein
MRTPLDHLFQLFHPERGSIMEKVKVKKSEALDILRKNREAHKAIFDEAVAGYKAQTLKLLNDHIKQIKSGKVMRITVSLPQPEEHTKDYDRAIKMLEMSVDDVIEVDEQSFQSYIMDDWHWKHQFLHSNSTYSGTALAAMAV